MASVHPIMDALREEAHQARMTLSKLARVANLSQMDLRKRETENSRRLWCSIAGAGHSAVRLTLIEIDPPHPNLNTDEIGERLGQALAHAAVPGASTDLVISKD